MNVFTAIEEKVREEMRRVLDERALDFLIKNPRILRAIIVLRQVGKFEISEREAQMLVQLGVLQIDKQGYFLSEAVEDLIEYIILKAEVNKGYERLTDAS